MRLSITVPAYNEADNLVELVPALDKALADFGNEAEIIVVDNASTDNTKEVLRDLKAKFPRLRPEYEGQKGFGSAILRGLAVSQGDVIGYIHADNQMDPTAIGAIYQKLKSEGLALCKATRLDRHDGVRRWFITKGYNFLFRLMFGITIGDINGSPKLFTKEFFKAARIGSRDWFIDPEIVIKAARLKLPIGQVGIRTKPRAHGVSQVSNQTVAEFIKNMWRYWRQK